MHKISIARKILSLVAVGVLSIILLAGYGLYHLKQVMLADRQAAVRLVVEEAIGVAAFYQKQVVAGTLSEDAAQTQAKAVIRSLRFGSDGYLFAYTPQGVNLIHGTRPELEGLSRLNDTDPLGRHYIQSYITQAEAGGGYTAYATKKPGQGDVLFEKTSYSSLFKPWQWVIASGVYIDDLDAAFAKQAMTLAIGVLVAMILLAVASYYFGRSITRPITGMAAAMRGLASGDLSIMIDSNRRDEIGEMAKAVQYFKEISIAKREADERERLNQEQRIVVAQRLETLAQRFDGVATGAIGSVSTAATSLQSTSEGMSQTASRTSMMAGQVVAAAAETSSNVQTVASAAEQLAASIREISSQVSQSSRIAAEAVSEAEHTTGQVQALAEAADKIGAVVNLISQIASQTNLLALNATIEAARAGDAGKGFAVVASEVKQLANQTARATTDIANQITLIQAETGAAVKAIGGISETVRRIDGISAGISAAVEEQGSATQEIARSVQQAANGARHVMETISGVESAADETKAMAQNVLSSSTHLGRQCDSLKGSVVEFLEGVRA